MKQKDIFLESEADAWYMRNSKSLAQRNYQTEDQIVSAIASILQARHPGDQSPVRILEVGCGEARRLSWLQENMHAEVCGIEPSSLAVEQATQRGLNVQKGTADKLPFEDNRFDIVIYGFCLYLCDRKDLFRIAQEADRVLKNQAWLIIQDFYSPTPTQREYHHRHGLYSYKMDYRKLFDWNPAYTCYSHHVGHHATHAFTDTAGEWVALSVLRKSLDTNE